LFRYRQQLKQKQEFIVILTPHIVRSPLDADRMLWEEGRRMDWVLGDVLKMHGPRGLDVLSKIPTPHLNNPNAKGGAGAGGGCNSPDCLMNKGVDFPLGPQMTAPPLVPGMPGVQSETAPPPRPFVPPQPGVAPPVGNGQ